MLTIIIIAGLFFGISQLLQVQISVIYCLLSGTLISLTDPIAVLGILIKANVPKKTEDKIVGESLFNKGVGLVVIIALLDTLKLFNFGLSNFGFLFIQ